MTRFAPSTHPRVGPMSTGKKEQGPGPAGTTPTGARLTREGLTEDTIIPSCLHMTPLENDACVGLCHRETSGGRCRWSFINSQVIVNFRVVICNMETCQTVY